MNLHDSFLLPSIVFPVAIFILFKPRYYFAQTRALMHNPRNFIKLHYIHVSACVIQELTPKKSNHNVYVYSLSFHVYNGETKRIRLTSKFSLGDICCYNNKNMKEHQVLPLLLKTTRCQHSIKRSWEPTFVHIIPNIFSPHVCTVSWWICMKTSYILQLYFL